MSLKSIFFKQQPQIYIEPQVQEWIDALHKKAKNLEWGGLIFYKITNSDLSQFSADIQGIFPAIIDTSAHFEFDFSAAMYKSLPRFPQWDFREADYDPAYRIGLIHTHHSLEGGSRFSKDDNNVLEELAPEQGIFLSVIAHVYDQYSGKLAVNVQSKVHCTPVDDRISNISYTTNEVVCIDCEVYNPTTFITAEKEEVIANLFAERTTRFAAKKEITYYEQAVSSHTNPSKINKKDEHLKTPGKRKLVDAPKQLQTH